MKELVILETKRYSKAIYRADPIFSCEDIREKYRVLDNCRYLGKIIWHRSSIHDLYYDNREEYIWQVHGNQDLRPKIINYPSKKTSFDREYRQLIDALLCYSPNLIYPGNLVELR